MILRVVSCELLFVFLLSYLKDSSAFVGCSCIGVRVPRQYGRCSYVYHKFKTSGSASNSIGMMSSSAAETLPGTPSAAGRKKGFWDSPRTGVPAKFSRAIAEEPWRGLFEPCVDHSLTEIEVEGKMPDSLEGTLFRNGAGRNRDGDRAYGHWFDGDGHVTKIVFKDGRVYAQNRFVSTAAWDPNAPAGEGSAGAVRAWTPRPGGWSKNAFRLPANPCNTSVMMKGGRLYALSEGGKPTEMDPVTLDTIEESDLGGISAFYSAHPTTDAATGETFNIGIGGAKGALELTRLSPDGTLDKSASFAPPASYFWHDNSITDDFLIGITSPYVGSMTSIVGAMLGFGQVGNAFQWDPTKKSEAFLFSRETLELVKRVELPGTPSSYHILNSFQEEGNRKNVKVVIVKLRGGGRDKLESTFENVMSTRFSSDILCDPYEYVIDVDAGKVVSHGPAAPVEGALPMELPTVDPRFVGKPHRFIFTNAMLGDAGFLNSVQRGDVNAANDAAWTTHDFGQGRFAGEPVFVPKSNDAEEGDGYLLVHVYNIKTHTTDIEVLDAQGVDAPPLCVAHVPWHMGTSFHGVFVPHTYLNDA